jgi:predicted Zn-dependent protease
MKMKNLFLAATVLLVTGSCKKEDDNVPNTAVDITIYTNNPSFVNVSVPGGWVYITGGVRGILLYRKSTSEFMAYDRN